MHSSPDVDRLLANASWVKALAVRLVADEAAADDVAQETWLRALERPPSAVDTARSLRAWLARVVARFALQRRRCEDAAERRERVAALPEAMPDVAEVVAHAELHRRVVDAVLALEEPYRATLLMRFFEDETPARVAERMNVPQKTVYTRLQRGLERLRARFDVERRPGGEMHAWVAPLLLPVATSASLGPVLREIVVMSGRTRVAIAALIVAGVSVIVWRAWPTHPHLAASDASASAAAPVPATAGGTPDAASSAASRVGEPVATERTRSLSEINEIVYSGSISLSGRIVEEDGTPIEGARLELSLPDAFSVVDGVNHVVDEELRAHGFWDAPCSPPRTSAASDARGRFTIPGLRTGFSYTLSITAAGFRSQTRHVPPGGWGSSTCLGAGATVHQPDVVMSPGRDFTVHVVDAHGADVGGVAVFSNAWPDTMGFLWPNSNTRRGVTDAKGTLVFSPERSDDVWIAARAPDGREAIVVDVKAPAADASDAEVRPTELHLEDGDDLLVRVRDGGGNAVPGIRVTLRSRVGGTEKSINRDGISDDDGVVHFRGLAHVERELSASAPGGMPQLGADSATPMKVGAETREVDLLFPLVLAPIPVRFVDAADGSPVRATSLLVVDAEVDGPDSGLIRGGKDVPTRGIARIGADATRGTILIGRTQGHPTGPDRFPREEQTERFRVIVDARDHARTWLGPFDPKELSTTEPLKLELERGRMVKGTLVDETGAPIPGGRLHEIGPGPGRASNMFTWQIPAAVRAARTEANGAFTIGPLGRGSHRLVADATGFVAKTVDVAIGADEPDALTIALGRGRSVEGDVRLEPGEDASEFAVVLDRRGERVPDLGTLTTSLDDDGHFSFTTLPPGDYAILALLPPRTNDDWYWMAMRLLGSEKPAPQVVRFSVADATPKLHLDAWREEATRRHLDTQVIDTARPGAKSASILFLDKSGLPHHETAAIADGRLAVDLPEFDQCLVLLTEETPATDRSDFGKREWYCASFVVRGDDLKRGVPPLRVRRGTLDVHVVPAANAALEEGAHLWVSFFVDPGFSGAFPELLTGNTRSIALGIDGRVTIRDLPVGRTWLDVFDGSSKGRGETYVNVVENTTTEVELTWK